MLINEIGVRDEVDVVELDDYRDEPDPKSRESMTTILAVALASEGPEPQPAEAAVIELAAPAPAPAAQPGDVGHAA